MFVILFVRALRPLVLIRFGALPTTTIGPFTVEVELFLCERDAGMKGRRTVDFFYSKGLVVNKYLETMWGRVFHISRFAEALDAANRRIPASLPNQVPWRRRGSLDIHGLLDRTTPHLTFTDEEERLGQEFLRGIGVPDGGSFVCFHARDQAYLASVMPEIDETNSTYRNINVQDFLPAMEALANRGHYGLRMGAIVQDPLPPTGPMIIDYASHGRTEFLDIYLSAKCKFFLGCASGIIFTPMIFRRPVVLTNFTPMDELPAWSKDYIFIPKKLWSLTEHRLLTFREMLALTAHCDDWGTAYTQSRIEVIDNTPEEITAVATEMDGRINETWESTAEDDALSKEFWSLFKPSPWNRFFACRIGTEFLRQNKDLLQ